MLKMFKYYIFYFKFNCYKARAPAAEACTSKSVSDNKLINLGTIPFSIASTFPSSCVLQKYFLQKNKSYTNLRRACTLLCLIFASWCKKAPDIISIPLELMPSSGLKSKHLSRIVRITTYNLVIEQKK